MTVYLIMTVLASFGFTACGTGAGNEDMLNIMKQMILKSIHG